jgi:hypothetical protein
MQVGFFSGALNKFFVKTVAIIKRLLSNRFKVSNRTSKLIELQETISITE